VRQIEEGEGLIAERFAFCQSLPLADYQHAEQTLAASGYRPLHLRPFSAEDRILVACLWTRDALEWRSALNLSADQVRLLQIDWQSEGFLAYDVAGYLDDEFRYAVLAAKNPSVLSAELHLGLTDSETAAAWERIRAASLMFHGLHVAVDETNAARYSWVTQERPGSAYRFFREFIPEDIYQALLPASGLPLVDVAIHSPVLPAPAEERHRQTLQRAEEVLRTKPNDNAVRRARGPV
jgi:hypothetical protein